MKNNWKTKSRTYTVKKLPIWNWFYIMQQLNAKQETPWFLTKRRKWFYSNSNKGMNTEYTIGIWLSSIWIYLHVHFFFFLQAFCSIRKSFTFYQVLRSDLTLGLQLLKGRNTSRMPEDTLLPVPKDTATSAWVDFYAPVLCWGHVGVTGPWVPCLCLMRTWCAGGMSGVFPCLDLCTTESYLFLNLAPQSPISRASLSSASTAAHQAAWRPFLIWQEELCPMPADRRLPKGVLASVHSG